MTHLLHHITSTILPKVKKVDAIVGLDARGFLLGPILALRLGAAFVPVRKVGKLPGRTTKAEYKKEYGTVSPPASERRRGSLCEAGRVRDARRRHQARSERARRRRPHRHRYVVHLVPSERRKGLIVAKGGSAYAAGELVKKMGGKVLEYLFIIELVDLAGTKKLDGPSYSVVRS